MTSRLTKTPLFLVVLIGLMVGVAGISTSGAVMNLQEQAIASLLLSYPGQTRSGLTEDPILSAVARSRAADLAARNYFSHTNPDGYGPNALVLQAGYALPEWWGTSPTANYIESIAAGQTSGSEAWAAWMASPPHRTHLLAEVAFYRDQTAYGVGYAYNPASTYKHYWVVITAPPAPVAAPMRSDFNRDGKRDIVWQNDANGLVGIGLMNRTTYVGWKQHPDWGTSWKVVAADDFNNDGNTDIVWQDYSTGRAGIGVMNRSDYSHWIWISNWGADMRIVGSGDFNGDGSTDLLYQNTATGQAGISLVSSDPQIAGWVPLSRGNAIWKICGTADFDGDGKLDILWQAENTGSAAIQTMNGTAGAGWFPLPEWGARWKIKGAGDYNLDGKADVLWQLDGSGSALIALMNGLSYSSWTSLPAWNPVWRIVGPR